MMNSLRGLWMGVLGVVIALGSAPPVLAAPATASVAAQKASPRGTAVKPKPSRKTKAKVIKKRVIVPVSQGQRIGLHNVEDPLDLKSGVALVLDQETNEVLFAKNPEAVLPIASITKLMTALVVLEAGLPLDESLSISTEDVDTEKGSRSRLRVGNRLTREEMLHLALMASENRAANALGRHFPGGMDAFVSAMNRKAAELGMSDTRYVEPTGLSSRNQSSAADLALLVKEADKHELIRRLSTSPDHAVAIGSKRVQFRNTNGLVRSASWDIGLQKTGYISEAGRCLVMQAQLAGRKLIMVLLDSAGKYSRIGDAERIRRWLSTSPDQPQGTPAS